MTRHILLATTLLAAAPVAASAQAVSGLYIGAGAGANFMGDERITGGTFPAFGVPIAVTSNTRLQYDTGFAGVVSVGYGLGNGLRVELEGSYRQNGIESLRGNGQAVGGTAAGRGDQLKYGAMVNVLYDVDFGLPVVPYFGVGAGWQHSKFSSALLSGRNVPIAAAPGGFNFLYRSTGEQDSVAVQAILGAAFPIASIPGLSVTAEYRFLALPEQRTYNFQYFAPQTATRARLRLDENFNHSLMVGVRYAFNAAPAPVMAVPAAAVSQNPSRTYLVFFDWDRADLTDRARQIIAEAAQATTRVQTTRIEVSGHTDSSGTARYNQGLSVRRAQNVAAELVRLGVPRGAITTQGYGETRPLVQTANGVREPQNRRVEIVLR